jgi:predicted nucleic acid-binding protein
MAEAMVEAAPTLPHELVPGGGLAYRAFELAANHGLSAYDAMYLALSESRSCDLVTADLRLIAKAKAAGLAVVVREP